MLQGYMQQCYKLKYYYYITAKSDHAISMIENVATNGLIISSSTPQQ